MDYFSKKEENKKKAIKHTQEMSRKYAQHIGQSVEFHVIYGEEERTPKEMPKGDPQFVFLNTDSVSALFEEGAGKTAVLNFASYKNPGGMFLNGSSAQEECLCHESTLYNVLVQIPQYYNWNKQHLNRALYLNRAVYTPGIVFEHNNKALLADVITCAAPNFSAASKYQRVTKEENEKVMLERMLFVKRIAEENEVKTLITGAFGCGVFGQDAEYVARISEDLFKDSCIKKVAFAVPGNDKNSKAFEKMVNKLK